MTDNEIIKALECCTTYGVSCTNCPAFVSTEKSKCRQALKGAVEIINRQRAEIERLKKGWKADVIETAEIKSEAFKKTIEAIKRKSCSCVMTDNGIPVAGTRHYTISEVDLCEIVKEVVGDNNDG